jgi:hypothetical protein
VLQAAACDSSTFSLSSGSFRFCEQRAADAGAPIYGYSPLLRVKMCSSARARRAMPVRMGAGDTRIDHRTCLAHGSGVQTSGWVNVDERSAGEIAVHHDVEDVVVEVGAGPRVSFFANIPGF